MYTKYLIMHILLGVASGRFPWIDVPFLCWQWFQYMIGYRVYLLEMDAHRTNDLRHTLSKLGEYYVGKVIYQTMIWYLM